LNELSEYLDESLDAEVRAKLESHITECPNCWVIADTTRKTIQIYKGTERYQIPEDVEARLMNALEKKIAAKR
jgi:anti-sigma factor RsiW